MSLIRGFITPFVRNPVLSNLTALGIFVGGIVVAYQLPRETFPETAIDHLTATVVYPGASPRDVEEGICVKMEQAMEGIPGIWEIGSVASDGVGVVIAAFDPKVASTGEILRQVQDRVNAIRTFPKEAQKPIVEESIVRNAVITVAVHGSVPEQVIKSFTEEIRSELLADPRISQVTSSGVRDYEISVRASGDTLRQYGLSLQHLIEAISRGSLDLPAGTLRTPDEEINIRTRGQRYTAREFEDLVVIARPDGSSVRLGQIAEIKDAFEDAPLFGRVDGEPGATLHVLKTKQEDISTIAGAVREYVVKKQREMPDGVHLAILADKSRDVDARIGMLIQNGLVGMALLLICLLFFMDLRAALGVAMGLPVAMGGALLVMWLTGSSLNLISLFGLIMADAIVLDDSIVIADSVLAREKEGLTPALAAVEGTSRVWLPVITSSLTTCIMFMPMLFVEGVMGKLIFVLPVVVIASIGASLAEAFVILPAHLCEWAGLQKKHAKSSWRGRVRDRLDRWIQFGITRGYRPMVTFLVRTRFVVVAGSTAALMICAGLVWGGRTPFVLFPKLDCNTIRARVRFPEGTPVEVSQATVARLEAAALALNTDPKLHHQSEGDLVRHVSSVVGEWTDFITKRGSGLCEVTVELTPAEQRILDVSAVVDGWRSQVGEISQAEVFTITREELGPTDKPIEIRLLGDDLDELRRASDELEAKLAGFVGVSDIDDDLLPGKRELQVSLKTAARNLGLTLGELATQLRYGLFGGEAIRLQRGLEEVKVVVSHADPERQSLGAIGQLRVRTPTGDFVPFHEVADTQMERGFSAIGRQDGKRRVRVQADVDERVANAEQIVLDLEKSFLPELRDRFPGVTYRIDGQRKRIDQSLRSLFLAFVVAGLASYAILGAALRSYVKPLILMTAVPLGLVGAIVGHSVMGFELSLMSVFGMTSLAGIVVNDALVLVDEIHRNLSEGMSVHDSVVRGAESRVIAVFLTAITNVAGMAPLLAEKSTQAIPLIPIAISVAFGLCFAMVLTLLVVPALYLVMNDMQRFTRWLRRGGVYPSAEQVESALHDGAVMAA
ncbi:MAG: efflux RND transporter permease subunit [Planctomycetota bacterium]